MATETGMRAFPEPVEAFNRRTDARNPNVTSDRLPGRSTSASTRSQRWRQAAHGCVLWGGGSAFNVVNLSRKSSDPLPQMSPIGGTSILKKSSCAIAGGSLHVLSTERQASRCTAHTTTSSYNTPSPFPLCSFLRPTTEYQAIGERITYATGRRAVAAATRRARQTVLVHGEGAVSPRCETGAAERMKVKYTASEAVGEVGPSPGHGEGNRARRKVTTTKRQLPR
ncbi:hypothetical protein HPB50_008919 [Hyalomma asiaticum]|uniref:Uncharacterized protein n=1 Tax=Hyalomma asiaticum TaxID=266040 RepID=A0ACB7THD7_HYAAI|nr:hypothetical protein HPB50_008919 [Hyalomma asiaticum]